METLKTFLSQWQHWLVEEVKYLLRSLRREKILSVESSIYAQVRVVVNRHKFESLYCLSPIFKVLYELIIEALENSVKSNKLTKQT